MINLTRLRKLQDKKPDSLLGKVATQLLKQKTADLAAREAAKQAVEPSPAPRSGPRPRRSSAGPSAQNDKSGDFPPNVDVCRRVQDCAG